MTDTLGPGPELVRLEGEAELVAGEPLTRYRAVWYLPKAQLEDGPLIAYISIRLAADHIRRTISRAGEMFHGSCVTTDHITWTAQLVHELVVVEV